MKEFARLIWNLMGFVLLFLFVAWSTGHIMNYQPKPPVETPAQAYTRGMQDGIDLIARFSVTTQIELTNNLTIAPTNSLMWGPEKETNAR